MYVSSLKAFSVGGLEMKGEGAVYVVPGTELAPVNGSCCGTECRADSRLARVGLKFTV